MAGDERVGDEMEDDDRGWPLGEAQIRAKYQALVQRDLERRRMVTSALQAAKAKTLGHDGQMPDHNIAVTSLPKSRSTKEAYSRARSLQRVLRRAGLADTSGKASQSVPVSSPSSLELQNSGAGPSLLSRVESRTASPVDDQSSVLALRVDVPKLPTSASQRPPEIYGKQTKFLAKQFKMISSSSSTTPRRNIMILGKAASPSTDAAAAVISVAGKIESSQLQERIREHDGSNPSSMKALVAKNQPGEDHQISRLECSPARTSVVSRKPSTADYYYPDHAHANSPSSVISDDITEASVPETVLSSPDSKFGRSAHRMTKLTSGKASLSFARDTRWTSHELFGSYDFGGELDIDETITEARNGRSCTPHEEFPDSESSWSLDGSVDSPSSGMRSPRQSSATSPPPDHQHDYQIRGRVAQRGVHTRRMKVTSPSSLFRDGPFLNGDDHPKPQSCPTIPRKLSRKLSTSFNKRRKQVQPHPPPPPSQLHARDFESQTTSSGSSGKLEKPARTQPTFKGSLTVEIAALLSGFQVNDNQARLKISNRRSGMSQQEATTAFQDDIAQLMLDRSESNEIGDIEEFLDGYMRLRSPFYLEVVEEFFRTVSYDCYKRPLGAKKLLPPRVNAHR